MKYPVLLPNIFDYPFTYSSKKKLQIGQYVKVTYERMGNWEYRIKNYK